MDEGTQSYGPDDQISSEQDQEYQHDLLQLSPTNRTTIQHSVFQILALFIWLIIRLIQLVFSAGIVFFSHKKSANSIFQPTYNSSRTGPLNRTLKISVHLSYHHQ
jgi:hypothetical protein